jgi:hypothetical protein
MDERRDGLEIGRTYAIRAENGLYLEPAVYVGLTLYEFGPRDARNFQRRAWAREDTDGWWLPTWAWDVRMSWDEYLALPEGGRPL